MKSSRLIGAVVGAVLSLAQVARAGSDCDYFNVQRVSYVARSNFYSTARDQVRGYVQNFEAAGMRLIVTSPNSFADQTIQRNLTPNTGIFLMSVRIDGIGFHGAAVNPDSYRYVTVMVQGALGNARLVQLIPMGPETKQMAQACLDLNDLEKGQNLLKLLPGAKMLGGAGGGLLPR